MAKKVQRPVDLKDMPWSHIGKDALDGAAERVWEVLRNEHIQLAVTFDRHTHPYHLASSASQTVVQRVVLDVLGSTVPALLRERAKSYRGDPEYGELYEQLRELADEIESDHG